MPNIIFIQIAQGIHNNAGPRLTLKSFSRKFNCLLTLNCKYYYLISVHFIIIAVIFENTIIITYILNFVCTYLGTHI